jgi:SRSO17 transposase
VANPTISTPGHREDRFAEYLNGLAKAAEHADRAEPLKAYCTGLLLPGERKSVEPMAARLAPHEVGRTHQSLHHLVAKAPWSDDAILEQVRGYALPAMQKEDSLQAWIVDDTGMLKKGQHSVGVARQYCGQVGKQDNCQVAVSLSVATNQHSLPIAFRLYLPEVWAKDKKRRKKAGVPKPVRFQTKPQIAREQIRQALEQGVPRAPVLADAGYGVDGAFRAALTAWGLAYVVGVQSSISVWEPGQQPLAAKPWNGQGRPTKLLRRNPQHQPTSAKRLAHTLPATAWKTVKWRQGSQDQLHSRFAAVRVRPAHRDYEKSQPYQEEWLLIEWPAGETEPAKYWLSTLPADTALRELVRMAKHRWIIERDYEELKQELGLGHYEGRGWRGFHHHATLCIAAYGFLVAERSLFSPSAGSGDLQLRAPKIPPDFQPRGSASASRTA